MLPDTIVDCVEIVDILLKVVSEWVIIRFGYVANAVSLWDSSPSKTVTFTRWKALPQEERFERLKDVTRQNLHNTLRMLYYNIGHQIQLYRMSSSLVPLATHPEVRWDFRSFFHEELREIGELVKKHQLRVSFHPNQFTLFTSDKDQITRNAVTDMEYHYSLLEGMGLAKGSFINIHVGGAYGDKRMALRRFHNNLQRLPHQIKMQTTLENDDKTYDAVETLLICQKEKMPMVFDYHHHKANEANVDLQKLIKDAFSTWDDRPVPPKVHLSSPKSEKEFRSHADYVNFDFVLPFLRATRELGIDYDIMIEAKKKDKALLQLVEDISSIRGVKRIGGATVEW